jgi:hypothetical protein
MTLNPLYSPLASMAWTLPVHTDAAVLPPGNFKKDATVRPSHGRPRGHRPIVRPSVRPSENVRVTTMEEGSLNFFCFIVDEQSKVTT